MDSNSKNNKGITIVGIIIALFFSVFITFLKTNDVFSKSNVPIEAYRVYLKGESIGLIKSDKELYDLQKQEKLKLREKEKKKKKKKKSSKKTYKTNLFGRIFAIAMLILMIGSVIATISYYFR